MKHSKSDVYIKKYKNIPRKVYIKVNSKYVNDKEATAVSKHIRNLLILVTFSNDLKILIFYCFLKL